MESLLQQLENESPAGLKSRSLASLTWFRQKVQTLKLSSEAFYRQSKLQKGKRYLEGRMYLFFYDAKTKRKLPYWDRFPLVFILELKQDGFIGLNLHYLPPAIRVRFLYELYKYEILETDDALDGEGDHAKMMRTKIMMTKELLEGIPKLRYYKACYKRYLTKQVYGRPLEVTPNHWDAMAMLPVAQWQKQNSKIVYKESMEKVNGG
tara:strand:- start:1750 stop:2370 length:621 start_codon:yes stop_codon:yes gene_type:complete